MAAIKLEPELTRNFIQLAVQETLKYNFIKSYGILKQLSPHPIKHLLKVDGMAWEEFNNLLTKRLTDSGFTSIPRAEALKLISEVYDTFMLEIMKICSALKIEDIGDISTYSIRGKVK